METMFLLAASDWAYPGDEYILKYGGRLMLAVILGAAVGFEREGKRRAAGLRTHMMVALGAAVFTIVPLEAGSGNLSEIVRGIAAGIGFLGAGAILKLTTEREILGLTTASSIWLTAAVGIAAGAGFAWMAGMAIGFSLVILVVMGWLENIWQDNDGRDNGEMQSANENGNEREN